MITPCERRQEPHMSASGTHGRVAPDTQFGTIQASGGRVRVRSAWNSVTCGSIIAAWVLLASRTDAQVDSIPRLPSALREPAVITTQCFRDARILSHLEECRLILEPHREELEEYNRRITRFCKSLVAFDARQRSAARQGRLTWEHYERLKAQIAAALVECDPRDGDYFAPYRARFREYSAAMKLHHAKRNAIRRRPATL